MIIGLLHSHNQRVLHSNSFQITFGFHDGLKFLCFISFSPYEDHYLQI